MERKNFRLFGIVSFGKSADLCGQNPDGLFFLCSSGTLLKQYHGERYYEHKLSYIEKGKLLDFIDAKQPNEQILAPLPDTKSTIRSERKFKELVSLLQVPEE